MANTYTQLLVQIVFAVQGRQNLIAEKHCEQLEKYICGIISQKQCKPLAIYCNPDHCHVLVGLNPVQSVASLARDIKSNSAKFINDNRWVMGRFEWQEGYGAFSYGRSQLDAVAKYIMNQPKHHHKTTFKEEYLQFLRKFGIEHDMKYIFDFVD